MKTDIDELRKAIAQLYPKRDRGDVTERDFQRRVAEQTVELYRAVIRERMGEGETIECEHHTIWTHFRLMQSILRETAQQATSFFLTNIRLYRLQSTVMPEQPPTADARDNTSVDVVSLDRIRSLKKKFQIRLGELLFGLAFCGIGILFHEQLAITGPVLIGLGILGALHALVMPTRWIEIQTVNSPPDSDPFLIYALRKKSAKDLVKRLQEKLRPA